jgi:transposase
MAKEIVSDALWGALEPLLPVPPPRTKGGRGRIANRAVLPGRLFVLKRGIPWQRLPPERGWGRGMTCWRRLRDGPAQGVWRRIHQQRLDGVGEADQMDWTRAAMDSATGPAPGGAQRPGRIRRLAAKRARSAILGSTGRASRWPLPSRGLTARTAR